MGSRFKARIERNKQILGYLIAEIRYARKNHVADLVEYIRPFIETGIIRAGWTWADIITILSRIRNKMIDVGKNEEFSKIFKSFSDTYNLTYSNWALRDVVMLFARLAGEHTNIMEIIFNDYVKEDEEDGI